jgi:hypothetical protein
VNIPGHKAFYLTFSAFLGSLMTLSPVAFYSKSPLVFFRFDGTFLLIWATMEKYWAADTLDFTSNPLQGLGGFGLFWHTQWEPGLWLAANLPPWIAPTIAMTFYAALLAVTICALGTRLGLNPLAAIAAAWIGLLLALPYVYPTLGFDFLWGVPTDITYLALNTAAILLFLGVGCGPPLADAARFIGLAGICAYVLMQLPNFAPVCLIALSFFAFIALLTAKTARERLVKLAVGTALIVLAAIVFGKFLYGMWGFSKPTFFWYEFYSRPGSLRDLSFFVAEHSRWPAWVVYGVSLAGALHAALRGGAAIRPMARGFLAFVLVNLAVVLLVNESWKGPRIAYIDIFAFPFYCVFAAYAVATAMQWLNLRIGIFRADHSWVGVVALCTLPWLVLIDYRPAPLERPLVRNLNPFIWPPSETPMTKFLAGEIAIWPGRTFRGRVASIAGSDFEREWLHAPFITQHNYDVMSLFLSGNDHRMYGLWYYGIPTLFETNQFSSPFFHLVNARLLNAPGARDLRSHETQSIVNDRIMALLGVRYLLSDKLLQQRSPVFSYRLVEGRDLHVYLIPDANLAGYSVTKVRHAASGQDVIALLADPAFDPRSTAVLTISDELPPLVPVSASSLAIERGGYRVAVDSPGVSLLVLPIEYSHCLHANLTTSGGFVPRLLRVNLTMTGVLLSGRTWGRLTLRYGPLSSECRIEDWREADALHLGDAREWPLQ